MVSEVIREIRENPEVREEVRRLILTDELLAVPAILARIDERQGRMDERQGRMEDRLDGMDERQGRMEDRQGRGMEDRQAERLDRVEEMQAPASSAGGQDRPSWNGWRPTSGHQGECGRIQSSTADAARLGLHSSEWMSMLPTGAPSNSFTLASRRSCRA